MGIPNPHPRSLAPGERLAVENPPHFSRVERILWNEASVGMIRSLSYFIYLFFTDALHYPFVLFFPLVLAQVKERGRSLTSERRV